MTEQIRKEVIESMERIFPFLKNSEEKSISDPLDELKDLQNMFGM